MSRSVDFPSQRRALGMLAFALAGLVLIGGCNRSPSGGAAKPTPPATVSSYSDELHLAKVTLTEQADARLGVKTAAIEQKPLPRRRTFAGEIMIPHGAQITVAAPMAGTLRVAGKGLPQAGATVAQGQALFTLTPLPAERFKLAESRATLVASAADAESQVAAAQVRLDGAMVALNRAKRLFRDEAGSQRAVDEAQEVVDLAEQAKTAAVARRDLLAKTIKESEAEALKPETIAAPIGGVLRNVTAAQGQIVPSGAALFEIIDARHVWIRVPVYVGELSSIADHPEAHVSNVNDPPTMAPRVAKSIAAPPSASPLSATADFYFELDNAGGEFRPGQTVNTTLPLKSTATSLIAPRESLLYDMHGGAWVYEQTAPRQYVRRRVDVRSLDGDMAVLNRGPAAGTKIVTAGSAELFGTEFGFGK